MVSWPAEQLRVLGDAPELQIAVRRADGTHRRWTTIWVVRVDGQVYVRTWHRRDTGWFGAALRSGRARVRAPGLAAVVVTVEDVAAGADPLSRSIDDAYRTKYGAGSASMVTPSASATTLRLVPRR